MKGFPKTEDGLKALVRKPSDEKKAKRWAGPYLDESDLPADPWDNGFIYTYESSKDGIDRPVIVSKGPDGEENTDDDIYNYKPSEGDGGDSEDSGSSDDGLDLGSDNSSGDFE
jgi:general secretion pathway protein G